MPIPGLCLHLGALGGGCSEAFPPFSQQPQQKLTAARNTGDKVLLEHPLSHGDTQCFFLYPSLLQRCYQLQPLQKNSWHLFEQRALSKAHRS